MGWDLGRIGLGIGTLGGSELLRYGAGQPMRQENPAYAGVDRSNFNVPGSVERGASLDQFARERGGGQFMQQQGDLASLLMRQAQGQDSLAAEQLKQNMGQLQAQQMSTAAAARPSNAALASRTASQNMGNIGAQMAGQSQMAQIAERMQAAGLAGGVIGQGRGQDIDAYLGAQGLGVQQALGQGQLGAEYEAQRTARAGQSMQSPSMTEGLLSGLSAAGPLLASDIRLKQNIRPLKPEMDTALIGDYQPGATQAQPGGSVAPMAQHQVRKFVETPTSDDAMAEALARIPSYEFEYKPGVGMPPGKRVGQMAQDIEKVAPGAVANTPMGKAVDYQKLTPAILALVQKQQAELDELKGKKELASWEKEGMGR